MVTFDSLANHSLRKKKYKLALLEYIKEYYLDPTNGYESEEDAIKDFIGAAAQGFATCGIWYGAVYHYIMGNFYLPYRKELRGTVLHYLRTMDPAAYEKVRAGRDTECVPQIGDLLCHLVDEMAYNWSNKLAQKLGLPTLKSHFKRLA